MTKTVKNMSFSKGACKKKNAPAASLKRSNNGLGLPIHIKKGSILLNIRYYILSIRYYLYILPIYYLYILPKCCCCLCCVFGWKGSYKTKGGRLLPNTTIDYSTHGNTGLTIMVFNIPCCYCK